MEKPVEGDKGIGEMLGFIPTLLLSSSVTLDMSMSALVWPLPPPPQSSSMLSSACSSLVTH